MVFRYARAFWIPEEALKMSKPVLLLPRKCLAEMRAGCVVSVEVLRRPYLEGDSSGRGDGEGRRAGFRSGVGGVSGLVFSTVELGVEERCWEVWFVTVDSEDSSVESSGWVCGCEGVVDVVAAGEDS